jgi:hypothetical protein
MHTIHHAAFVVALAVLGCGSSSSDNPPAADADGGTGNDATTTPVVSDDTSVPEAVPATVDVNPTSPKDDTGKDLSWAQAPLMNGVLVAANRDSAIFVVPEVAGAQDYRIMTVPGGVDVKNDNGAETVNGAAITCAGYRQHNAPQGPRQLLRQIEVTALPADVETRLVIEAVDQGCPFAGLLAGQHGDVNVTFEEVEQGARGVFSVFTEQEIRSKYGSLLLNGHVAASKPGQQAPYVAPKVLARTTVRIKPRGTAQSPTTFFDDFTQDGLPQFVQAMPTFDRSQQGKMFSSDKFTFYTYGATFSQFFFARGQMHMLLADWDQDIMSSNVAYPKKPMQLSDTDYLHVTFEVASNATSRRYWWMLLCGADQAGKTMAADGKLLGNIIQTPFFMDNDGRNPSVEGWNCLQLFPRQGWPFSLAPDNTNPESEVRVMVNKAGQLGRDSVVNVSPMMWDSTDTGPPSWFRQLNAQKQPSKPILDDQQLLAPRAKFDVFIKRDRLVMYVNGEQRICNDFGAQKLTMAEGALGYGQVLYHSAAERLEFNVDYWVRTGQRYYIENTPFIDVRSWDNVGYSEHVGLPQKFDESVCFSFKP